MPEADVLGGERKAPVPQVGSEPQPKGIPELDSSGIKSAQPGTKLTLQGAYPSGNYRNSF